MSFLFFIILLLFIIERNDGCMQTPAVPPIIIITKTTTTEATTTTKAATTTTPKPTTTTTTSTTSTTTTTTTPSTSFSTITSTTSTTTTTTIDTTCVPPAGSSSVVIAFNDLVTGIAAATFIGAPVPFTGACSCGDSLIRAYFPSQTPFPAGAPTAVAFELCFNVFFPFLACNCQMQCVCDFAGNCYAIGVNPALGTAAGYSNDVQYFPYTDGTFYAYVFTGLTYDDRTGAATTLPFGFQVAAIGCSGCAALRAEMALTCSTVGPFTAYKNIPPQSVGAAGGG